MATEFNITVRADRDFYLPVSVVTALGNPADLTNFQPMMTVKKVQTDPDASALYKQAPTVENLPFGKFTFHITPTQNSGWWIGGAPVTTTIVYDVSTLDIAIPPNLVTLMEGTVAVIGPVTVAIP